MAIFHSSSFSFGDKIKLFSALKVTIDFKKAPAVHFVKISKGVFVINLKFFIILFISRLNLSNLSLKGYNFPQFNKADIKI
jgi:hypothetical protein